MPVLKVTMSSKDYKRRGRGEEKMEGLEEKNGRPPRLTRANEVV